MCTLASTRWIHPRMKLLKSSSGEFPELVVSTETFLVTRSLYTRQSSGFEWETVVTDAARDRGSQTWNWKWKTISCFNWKVSTHHLALWNIVSGTKFSQPWIKVSLTSCLNNLIIKCQGFKISWTIFTFQLEQTAFTQSKNLTLTSLLITLN